MTTVGVDLGGTKTLTVLVDDGEIVEKNKRPTPRVGGPDDVIDTILATIDAVDPKGKAKAIGVGVPGPVRPGTGIVPAAPNLPGWDHEVDVAARLAEALEHLEQAARLEPDDPLIRNNLARIRRAMGQSSP